MMSVKLKDASNECWWCLALVGERIELLDHGDCRARLSLQVNQAVRVRPVAEQIVKIQATKKKQVH